MVSSATLLRFHDWLSFVFTLCGLMLVSVGTWMLYSYDWGSQLIGLPLPAIFIGGGVYFLVCILVATVGLHKLVWQLVNFQLVMLLILILGEITAVALAFFYTDNAFEQMFQGWLDSADAAKNAIQAQLNCCGFSSPIDNPGSICPEGATTGCYPEMRASFAEKILILKVSGPILVFIQIVGAVVTGMLILRMPIKGLGNQRW